MRQQRTGTSSPLILIPIFSSLFSGSSSPCRTKWKYIKRVIVLYFLVGQVHWFVKFLLLGFVQFESQPSVDNSLPISRSLFLVCCLPGYFVYSWHDFSICPWSTWNAKAAPFLLRPIYWLWDFDNLYLYPYPYVAHPGLFRLYIYAFMFMYLIASLQFRLSCILPRRIWKLRWHGKVFDKRFKAHPWLTFLFFFFFCFLMKFIQYKDAKDVAANGKVFNFCCSVQLIEIFVCENLWFPPWKQTYIKSFCVFGIYQVWSLNKELRARWTTYLRKVFSAINFKSLFIKGKRHCKSFWTKNLA